MAVFLWQHHSQAQGSGGAEPGLGGVSGPAAGGVSGALWRGVALGAGRRGPEDGDRSGTRRHRHLQRRLQSSQQVPSFAVYVKHVDVERWGNDRIQISVVDSCSFI